MKISKEAELFLSFTNEMLFPSNFADILNGKNVMKNSTDSKPVKNKRFMAQEKTGSSLLILKMISFSTETIDENLFGWTVTDVSSRGITVRLNFTNPLQVSQGEKPDLILILVNFSNYTDVDRQNLPEFSDIIELPRQMSSASQA